jgi:hypothetical protein
MDPFTNCARKEVFPSRNAARARIRDWRARGTLEGIPEPYKCKVCHKVHIGRRTGRRGVQGRKRR